MDPQQALEQRRRFRRMILEAYQQEMRQQQQGEQSNPRSSSGNPSSILKLIESLGSGGAGEAAASGAGAGATGAGAVTLGSGGVATIPAGASVPAGYTAVGTSASGGTMVAPTASLGSAGVEAGASTLSTVGSYALPAVVAAALANNAWEGGLKDIVRGRGDRADWTNSIVNMTPIGAPINIGLRLLGKRSIGSMMKSGKSDAQKTRDDFRGDLKSAGIGDDNYEVTLADGSKFNVGLDGKTRYKNVGKNIDGREERQAWDVDFSNPLAKFATDRLDGLVRQRYGADNGKYAPGQFTGMLVNAVTSNAKSEADILRNIEALNLNRLAGEQSGTSGQQQSQQQIQRPGKGQVARVSPGMYMNDRGQVSRSLTSRAAMQQNYGNRIPRRGKQ
jgi:hypothetical protein